MATSAQARLQAGESLRRLLQGERPGLPAGSIQVAVKVLAAMSTPANK
jgi:hypothetical protein